MVRGFIAKYVWSTRTRAEFSAKIVIGIAWLLAPATLVLYVLGLRHWLGEDTAIRVLLVPAVIIPSLLLVLLAGSALYDSITGGDVGDGCEILIFLPLIAFASTLWLPLLVIGGGHFAAMGIEEAATGYLGTSKRAPR